MVFDSQFRYSGQKGKDQPVSTHVSHFVLEKCLPAGHRGHGLSLNHKFDLVWNVTFREKLK